MAFNPVLDSAAFEPLLEELSALREEFGTLDVPRPLAQWLRRHVEARGAHMSTSIEGNPMTEPEVRELFARTRETVDRAERENLDYRDAARFAQSVGEDPSAHIDAGMIRAFHYLVVRSTYRYDDPAHWRQMQNRVADGEGNTVYLPPPPGDVPGLMDALIAWLREQRGKHHTLVLGAVAHLEFVNIHPFDDGNGRVARALSAYFTERGGWSLRGMVSSEAAFGRDRAGYYAALSRMGARYYERSGDMTEWVAWVLRRFAIEVATALGVIGRWIEFLRERDSGGESDRAGAGYMYLALMGSASRAEYVAAVQVSPATAVRQLTRLVDEGVAERLGAGRATRYRMLEDRAEEFARGAREDALARFPLAAAQP
ncbi:MAG: Fic family protein [Dehalococcoidia bacterium]